MKDKLTKRQETQKSAVTTQEIAHLVFESVKDKKTGREKFDVRLSDGSRPDTAENRKRYFESLECATGSKNSEIAIRILGKVTDGSKYKESADQFNNAASMLTALKPQDETETLLLGQFLNLQDSGNAFLRRAHFQDGFYHLERFSVLAVKMFNAANQTMQALLKYRSRGQQVVQVVHLHNDGGQAIVAQNLSKPETGGCKKNSTVEPLG